MMKDGRSSLEMLRRKRRHSKVPGGQRCMEYHLIWRSRTWQKNGLPGRSQPLALFLEKGLVEELSKKLPAAIDALPDH